MILLQPMSAETFKSFKRDSQTAYATALGSTESIPLDEALKNAAEQFDRLVPNGINTPGQKFSAVLDPESAQPVGFLWLGIQNRFGRRVLSINDITIIPAFRGRGLGKSLMELVEQEAEKGGAVRIRLHVFHSNEIARRILRGPNKLLNSKQRQKRTAYKQHPNPDTRIRFNLHMRKVLELPIHLNIKYFPNI